MVTLDRKDLAKYPFLKESQSYIGTISSSLEQYLQSPGGKHAIKEASTTMQCALSFNGRELPPLPDIPPDAESITNIIASYPVSRIIVSCAQDRVLIDRLVRYQSWLVFAFLQDESSDVKRFIRKSIGLPETGTEISVTDYIPVASRMQEERWRLINRVVIRGKVRVAPLEYDEIVRERLRYVMARNLPIKVPSSICELLQPEVDNIKSEWQKHILEEFGKVEESAFPPCMQAILGAIAGQGHLTHMARFAISAFLHNIGMENTRIIELYGNVQNFDLRKTMYQVEHISGRGGTSTEYISPQCATMRTHGICIHPDSLCQKINHPLTYYKQKKREISKKNLKSTSEQKESRQILDKAGTKKSESGGDSSNQIPSRADGGNKDEQGT